MKKTSAFILIVIALVIGYSIGSMRSDRIPASTRSSIITLTASPTATPTVKPKANPNAASIASTFTQSIRSSSNNSKTSSKAELNDYVANKKSKKFHKPSCSSVDQMKESNKKYFYSVTRQSMIDKGYDPCGKCHP